MKNPPSCVGGWVWWGVGGVRGSRTRGGAVGRALEGLAAGFGMGPGVSRSAVATDPAATGGRGRVLYGVVVPLVGGWVVEAV